MRRTTNALEILKERIDKSPRLKAMLEEERANLKVALAIRAVRKEAGLTQAELAQAVGTTQSVIARLEDAEYRGHTLRIIENIAQALGRRVEISFRPLGERARPHLHAR